MLKKSLLGLVAIIAIILVVAAFKSRNDAPKARIRNKNPSPTVAKVA